MEPFVEAPVVAEIPPPAIEQTETGLDSLAQKAYGKLFGDQKMDLNSTFASVSGTNPDEAAKAQSVGIQVGVGQDLAMRNMAEVKKSADQKQFESYDLMGSNPVLARQMMNRDFASVAHDDIPQLSGLSTLFKVFAASVPGHGHLFPMEAAAEVYAGFTRGTNTFEYGNIGNEYLRTGDKELALKRKKEIDDLTIGLPEAQGFLGSTSEFIGNMVMAQPEAAAYAAAYGVGGLAIGAATGPGALATGAIGASAGYMTGMALTAFRVERGAMILDMLEKGYDEDTVQIVGNVAGSINAALEMTGLKFLSAPARKFATKFIKEEILKRTTNEIEKVGLKKLIKETTLEYGKGVFAESATETMQDVVGKLADKVVSLAGTSNLQFNSDGTIQSANPEQSMREFAGQLVDTFIYTAKGAAVLGMFGAGMQVRHNLKQIATAKETTQLLTDLSKNVQATKLKGRSPSALANFVAAQAQGTAAETMYVDAEEMTNVLNQSGLTAQQIDNALPGVREQLSKATSGGDIQIPTAQFAANIVGTKLEAPLMEHARLAPDAISAKQAIAQQETMQQNMKDAQVEMAVQEKVNAQFVREAKEIEKVVNDQLVAAGRPPTEALFAAKLVQARAVTGAAAAGITPAQWVAQHPVPTFQSQQQAAQAAQQAPAQGSFEQAQIAKIDSDYMAAVEGNDVETQQRMVDEAATKANLTEAFHSTKSKDEISEFRTRTSSINTMGILGETEVTREAAFFTEEEKFANAFGKNVKKYFLDTKNIYDAMSYVNDQNIRSSFIEWLGEDVPSSDPESELNLTEKAKYAQNMWQFLDGELGKQFRTFLESEGYSGIKFDEETTSSSGDVVGGTTIAIFNPQDIKSADPIKRNESGNIISLFQRFGQQDPNILRQDAIEKSATPKGFAKISAAAGIKANTKAAMGSKTKTGREFKLGIQKRVLDAAATAGIDLSVYTPEVRQYLISMAVSDAIAALDAGGSSAKAVGWYNEKVTKALRKIGLIHPEILTDPQAKFVFIWALATTSNGIKVDKNFRLAEEAYRYYKKSGKLPTNIGMGTSSAAINAGLQLFNKLSEKYSFEELEAFFTTKHTVKEVDAFTGRGVSGENQTTIVYGSAALGAKVGNGFFSNLYGHFEQLTIDRWLMRTWGRWSGNLVEYSPKNVAIKQKQLKSLIALLSKSDSAKLSDIIGVNINTSSANTIATAIKKASSKEAIRIKIIQIASGEKLNKIVGILGEPKANAKRIGIGDEIRKTGNSLWGYLDGQKEQPEGAVERGRMRDVFAAALAVIQQRFPDLTMADLQAVLWYPEKNLYDTAKADEGVESTYEEDKAPDFDNAAQKLALELGVTKEQLDEVTAQVDRDIIAERGSRRPGRSLDSGGYDGGVGSSQVLNQSAVPATFYSALSVEVGKSTTKSASADSWKQQIKGLIAKGVVKEKEVYWSGLDNWLDLQEGKITKEQVQAFLNDGGVKVEVVQLDQDVKKLDRSVESGTAYAKLQLEENGMLTPKLESAFAELEQLNATNGDRDRRLELHSIIDKVLVDVDGMDLDAYIETEDSVDDPSIQSVKYEAYQLPGGDNYRELVVTIPPITTTKNLIIRKIGDGKMSWKVFVEGEKDFAASFNTEEEAQLHIASYGTFTETEKTKYEDPHWPGIKNPVVHVRLNDRVDADGNKVMLVEEVQSGWGQAGREKGFIVSPKLIAAMQTEYESLVYKNAEAVNASTKPLLKDVQRAQELETELLKSDKSRILRAPFVETTSGWLELGLKQILLEAVNGGYDKVAFINGEQSAF